MRLAADGGDLPDLGRCVGDGHPQRHPRLVLRRRPVPRPRRTPSRTAWRMRGAGADLVDVGGESTRPGAERSTPEMEAARVLPVIARPGRRRACGSASTPPAPRSPRPRSRRARSWSTTCPAGWPTRRWPRPWPPRGCRGSSCTGAGPATGCTSSPGYEDVIGEVRAELVARVDAAVLAGVDPEPAGARPGAGLREDRRAQLGAAAPARRAASRSASRCWSGRRASGSSGELLAERRRRAAPARRT